MDTSHSQAFSSDSKNGGAHGATQEVLKNGHSNGHPTGGPFVPQNQAPAKINIPSDFQLHGVSKKLDPDTQGTPLKPPPPLGVLSNFNGPFAGRGFNTIFRPNSAAPTTTTFPNPLPPPAAPNPPNENVLELNLTTETLVFSPSLGSVPNRGLEAQNDIFLNGVPYVQTISDVSNVLTGKADGPATGIHFEPGLWMHIPPTTTDPDVGESLVRMGSIPHGTTINAQALAPTTSTAGPPTFPRVDITPFIIGQTQQQGPIKFASQTAASTNTPRLPQDLSKFIAAGTITQSILDDPNTVLRNAIKGQKIVKTIVFTVSTNPTAPDLGGGTANIAFLQGAVTSASGKQTGPNANAIDMTATFWIETVQNTIIVPPFKPGQAPLTLKPELPHPDALVPTFTVKPPHEITSPKTITVNTTQIQYSQVVGLNFAGLTWPHCSVATLVPLTIQTVPNTVWNS